MQPADVRVSVQMREVLEKFLDDDEDMHDMNLTAKEQDAQEKEQKREEVRACVLLCVQGGCSVVLPQLLVCGGEADNGVWMLWAWLGRPYIDLTSPIVGP
jgi:hypothetical protein